jgi:hypothetical protein
MQCCPSETSSGWRCRAPVGPACSSGSPGAGLLLLEDQQLVLGARFGGEEAVRPQA